MRTPTRVGCADAIGFRDPLNDNEVNLMSLAFLNETSTCFSASGEERISSGVSKLVIFDLSEGKALQISNLSFSDAEKKESSAISARPGFPSIPFVGFLKGIKTPLVINDRVIFFEGADGGSNSTSADLLFPDPRPRFQLYDTVGSTLSAMGASAASSGLLVLQSAAFDQQKNQFQAAETTTMPGSIIWPVLSPWTGWIADIDQSVLELRVRSKNGKKINSWPMPESTWQDPNSFVVLRNQPLRPIGFVRNTSWIVVRTGPKDISIYDVEKKNEGAMATFELPELLQSDPLRPSWFSRRPPIAGMRDSNGILVLAWATRRGIEVLRWSFQNGAIPEAPLVFSPDPGSTIADLRFLADDQLLITVSEPGTFALGFRMFDLSQMRRRAIEKMSDLELLQIACGRMIANYRTSPETDNLCTAKGG